VQVLERGEARFHGALGIVGAHHYRYARAVREARRNRLVEAPGNRPVRRLRHAGAIDPAEGPILDQGPAGAPRVGPSEYESAGDAHIEGRADLPGQDLRLCVLTLAE